MLMRQLIGQTVAAQQKAAAELAAAMNTRRQRCTQAQALSQHVSIMFVHIYALFHFARIQHAPG